MRRTASSFFSILDLTLSSDGVNHLNGGLSYPAPENTASIPSAAEPRDNPKHCQLWAHEIEGAIKNGQSRALSTLGTRD